MNIRIHSVRFDADQKLIAFIEEKISKLEVFYDDIIVTEVFLRLDKDTTERENKLVEIKIDIAGNTLFSKKQCKTFEEATDLSVEAMKKQLLKNKQKVRKS